MTNLDGTQNRRKFIFLVFYRKMLIKRNIYEDDNFICLYLGLIYLYLNFIFYLYLIVQILRFTSMIQTQSLRRYLFDIPKFFHTKHKSFTHLFVVYHLTRWLKWWCINISHLNYCGCYCWLAINFAINFPSCRFGYFIYEWMQHTFTF